MAWWIIVCDAAPTVVTNGAHTDPVDFSRKPFQRRDSNYFLRNRILVYPERTLNGPVSSPLRSCWGPLWSLKPSPRATPPQLVSLGGESPARRQRPPSAGYNLQECD